MDAKTYLKSYMRPVPGGAIAWRQSIFLHPDPYDPGVLIDLAVDIARENLGRGSDQNMETLDVRESGNYLVFSMKP